jgi:hypothetical protein
MMHKKKSILITLFLCLVWSMTSFADVIVYENDFEDPCQVDALSGWNWGDGGITHNVAYVDYEGNTVVEHTGIIDATASALTTRFGSKWGIKLSGNTSSDPNDYTIEFDLRSVSGNWDPIDLEFFVLTGGGNGVGYGSGASSYAQADGWVHVTANLADLPAGWWAGQAWDMTDPNWQIEVGGPPWPGVEVPAGTPAWDQIWLMDNLKITMVPSKTVDPGTDGLLAYYPLDDASSGITSDASGNGNDGTLMGDPQFVPGVVNQAIDLDGDGDYVDCGDNPLLGMQETNEMTAACWLTIRSIPAAWAGIVAKGEHAWRMSNVNLDPRFHFGISFWTEPTPSIDGVTAVGFDEWHHVAGVYGNGSVSVYLDGVLDASAETATPIMANEFNVEIGRNPEGTDRTWDGLIDELLIYNRALSAEEVSFLAQ